MNHKTKSLKKTSFIIALIVLFSLSPGTFFGESESAGGAVRALDKSANTLLTLELQSVNIFDVFKILSKKSGLNIVAGKNVQGQVSVFLQDVPAQDALKTILQSQGLASIEESGIIKVMPEEEYVKRYGRPYEDKRLTKIFHLKHASADGVTSKLADIKSPNGKIITDARTNTLVVSEIPMILDEMKKFIDETDQPQERSVLKLNYTRVEDLELKLKTLMNGSDGKLEIDKRSNSIFAIDVPDQIQKLREFVEAFDVKVPQVLIEAKIVEVQLSDAYRKGINWQEIIEKVGNFNTIEALVPLTVAPPIGAAALATLTLGDGQRGLQTILSLLEQVGKTNLLSSPRITVMDNEEAKLAVATRQPFVSQTVVQTVNSTNTADNVQFVDVGVTLKVQPHISEDGLVEMKIKPEVSSSNSSLSLEGVSQGSNTTFTRTTIPIVTTQELETTVQIRTGHTLIIGGLIQDHQSKSSSRLPFLNAIPFVGRAFESKTNDFNKTELVIFLTPLIVETQDNSHAEEARRFMDSKGSAKAFDPFAGYKTDIRYDTLIERRYPFWESPDNAKKKEQKNA